MNRLAVVVPKPAAEATIAALAAEGVYDDARRVVEHDADRVELPVRAAPRETAFESLVTQADPETRIAGLADVLRERGWDEADIERAPSSWAVVGDVVLVELPDDCPDPAALGAALLDLHGGADTVFAREGVAGAQREPRGTVIAGSPDTETIHTEHGTKYALDLAEVMFSPGNQAERVRMGEVVAPGERVLDMFAGVGYFALPMARAGADVVAVEANPTAFRYLAENVQLNDVADRVDCVLGDCREYRAEAPVDRVVMGYYDSVGGHRAGPTDGRSRGTTNGEAVSHAGPTDGEGPTENEGPSENADGRDPGYLDAALDAIADDGVVHVHTTSPEGDFPDRDEARVRAVAADRGATVAAVETRVVKSHSPGVVHGVLDVRLG